MIAGLVSPAYADNRIYIGQLGFSVDKMLNDVSYKQTFGNYFVQNRNEILIIEIGIGLNKYPFKLNDYLNNKKQGENALQYAIAHPTPIPSGAVVWNGQGNPKDALKPHVDSVTSNTYDGTYGTGKIIDVEVAFNNPVTVTGTPTLQLETGDTDRNAIYDSGSGTAALLFYYTVQAGDTTDDLDYTGTNALQLNGGSIKSAAGTDAVLVLPLPGAAGSLGNSKQIAIDATAPVLSNVTIGTIKEGDIVTATSNEAGFVYLVPANTEATTDALETAVATSNGAKIAASAGQAVNITTTGLAAGNYLVYAVDAAGNISVPSSAIVILSSAKDILAFSLTQQTGPAVINSQNHTINIEVKYGTNLTNLIATFTLSPNATAKIGTTEQVSGVTANDYTNPVIYTVKAQDGSTQTWTITVTTAKNSDNSINSFSFDQQKDLANIDPVNHTINIKVVSDTNLKQLVAKFKLPAGATAEVGDTLQVSGTTVNDYTNSVVYTVVAENGSVQNWTVTVTSDYSNKNDIVLFSIPQQTGPAVINNVNHTVNIEVANATDLTGLVATFTLSAGATAQVNGVAQVSGVTANNYTNPVAFKVTAQSGVAQDWMITVAEASSSAKDIKAFSFNEQTGPAAINAENHTVQIEVANGTDLSSLVAGFELSAGATAKVGGINQVSEQTANDFKNPVTYIIYAEDETTQVWAVTVTENKSSSNDFITFSLAEQKGTAEIDTLNHTVQIEVVNDTNLSNLVATFTLSANASAKIGETSQVSGETANDFTNPVTYTVVAEDGTPQNWVVTVTQARNPANAITTFSFAKQKDPAVINAENHTVQIQVENSTNLSSLVATFTLSPNATAKIGTTVQESGVTANDYTNPVIYTVLAEDGTPQDWTVTVVEYAVSDPLSLSAVTVSGTEVFLSWAPPVANTNIQGYEVYRDGSAIGKCEAETTNYNDTNLNYSASYQYNVKAIDTLGVKSPGAAIVSATTWPEKTLIVNGITNGALVNHDVTVTGFCEGETVTISKDGTGSSNLGQHSVTFSTDGQHTAVVSATGTGSTVTLTFTIDKTAPTVTIAPISNLENSHSGVIPQITFNGENVTKEVRLNGQLYDNLPIKKAGQYTLVASARDAAGNVGSDTKQFTITWDTTTPDITIKDGLTDIAITNEANYEEVKPTITLAGGTNLVNYTYTATLTKPDGISQIFTKGQEIPLLPENNEEGRYRLVVNATNPSYTNITGTKTVEFVIDNSAPTAAITGVTNNTTYNVPVTPVINFNDSVSAQTALNARAVLELTKNSKAIPYAMGASISEDGQYILEASTADEKGHVSNTDAKTFIIDRTKPVINLSGVIDGYNYKDQDVTITAQINEPGNLTVYDANSNEINLVGNQITFSVTAGEVENYQLLFVATDTAGNTNESRCGFSIDRLPVDIVVNGITEGQVINYSPNISFTTYEGSEEKTGTTAKIDGQEFTGGTYDVEGKHALTATYQTGGNIYSKTVNFTIDKSAPGITITSVTKNGEAVSGYIKAGDEIIVRASVNEGSGLQEIYFNVGQITNSVPMQLVQGQNYYQGTWLAPSGTYANLNIEVCARDIAGNTAAKTFSGTINIDNTVPTVSLSTTPAAADGDNNIFISPNMQVKLNAGQDETIYYTLNGTSGSAETSITLNSFRQGTNQITYYAKDKAGNQSDTQSYMFEYDSAAPAAVNLSTSSSGSTSIPMVSITGNVPGEGGAGAKVILKKSGAYVTETSVAQDGTFTISGILLNEGENVFSLVARDPAGNESANVQFSRVLDSNEPIISLKKVDDIHYSATASETVSNLTATFNGTVIAQSDITTTDAKTFLIKTQAPVAGSNKLIISANDHAGNVGTGSLTTNYIPPQTRQDNLSISNTALMDIPADAFNSTSNMTVRTGTFPEETQYKLLGSTLSFGFSQEPVNPVILKIYVGTGLTGVTLFHVTDNGTVEVPIVATETTSAAFNPDLAVEDQAYYLTDTGYVVIKTKNFSGWQMGSDVTPPAITINTTDYEINSADQAAGKMKIEGVITDLNPLNQVTVTHGKTTINLVQNGVLNAGLISEMPLTQEEQLSKIYQYKYSFNVPLELGQGKVDVTVSAEDRLGNGTTPGNMAEQKRTYYVDTIAPTLTVNPKQTLTNADKVDITLSVSEEVALSINGVDKGKINRGDHVVNVQLDKEGDNSFTIIARDSLYNEESKQNIVYNEVSQSVTIKRDTIRPVITINGIVDGGVYGSAKTISASCNEGLTPTVTIDGADFGNPYGVEGTHTLVATATDLAGNTTEERRTFTIDISVPTISISGVSNGGYYNGMQNVTITADNATSLVITQKTDGGAAQSFTVDGLLSKELALGVNGEEHTYTLSAIAMKTVENQNRIVSATTSFTIDNVKVTQVNAVNGQATVALSAAPLAAPKVTDFKITQSINGGQATNITATNIQWDAVAKQAVLTIPVVSDTDAAQSIVISVAYKTSQPVNAPPFNTKVLNTAKDIVAFSLSSQTGLAKIDKTKYTVTIEVVNGTNLEQLKATFALSKGATAKVGDVAQISGVTTNDYTSPVTFTVTAEDGSVQSWVITVSQAKGSATDILAFSFNQQTGPAVIDWINHTVGIEVAYQSDLAKLTATFALSGGATARIGSLVQTSGVTVNDYTNPVIYTVIAEDGTEQLWTITVTEKQITGKLYKSVNQIVPGSTLFVFVLEEGYNPANFEVAIDSISMTYKTDQTQLEIGADVITAANRFEYTVSSTAPIAQKQVEDIVVHIKPRTVNNAADILAYSLSNQVGSAEIDHLFRTIAIEVASGADLTGLVANFTLSEGAKAMVHGLEQTSGVTVNDFTHPVTYTVEGANGSVENWIVTVMEALSSSNNINTFMVLGQTGPAVIDELEHTVNVVVNKGTDRTNLVATFTLSDGAVAKVNGVEQVSGQTANDFTSPVAYTVIAEDGTEQNWIVIVTEEQSSANHILAFSLDGQASEAVIDTAAHSVFNEVPKGTGLTSLVAAFSLSEGAVAKVNGIDQISGVTANDYTNPVTYTVMAEDGTTQDWVVTVAEELSSANDITSLSFVEQISEAEIDPVAHAVYAEVAGGTSLTSLVATFSLSEGAVALVNGVEQISGETTNDYTAPLTYTVRAENGAEQDWTIIVREQMPTGTLYKAVDYPTWGGTTYVFVFDEGCDPSQYEVIIDGTQMTYKTGQEPMVAGLAVIIEPNRFEWAFNSGDDIAQKEVADIVVEVRHILLVS